MQNIQSILIECNKLNIKKLTVFGFSTENWKRVPSEVNSIIKLIERYLKAEIAYLNSNNIKFKVVGIKNDFGQTIEDLINVAEELTKDNTGLEFSVALNYGGRKDILECAKSISKMAVEGKIKLNEITEETVKENLLSSNISDIDLLIRTGGEQRISNFLLYQLAYSEIFFTKTLWPDFSSNEFSEIIEKFGKVNRRFGSSSSLQLINE